MTAELAGLIFLSFVCINTGVSFSSPFNDPKSILNVVMLIVVWILLVVGHAV